MHKMKDKFDLNEILDLKEKDTAQNHTWTYQDGVGLKIYELKAGASVIDIVNKQKENCNDDIYYLKKECVYRTANDTAKLLGVNKIIHIKHHFRSVV